MNARSCHDYGHLISRWRSVARAAGLRLKPFAESGGYPLYYLATDDVDHGGVYASAGIHGDEPAGCEGLLRWAQRHLARWVKRRRSVPALLFPCLNPWGLVNNRRTDAADLDLNRLFDRVNLSPIRELNTLIKDRHFDLALHLHEDFDGQGVYIYELSEQPTAWSRALLGKCRPLLPTDPRRRIDGRTFDRGVYFRHGRLRPIPINPEAIHLYRRHSTRVFTFETPSEYGFERRARVQTLLIEESIKLMLRDRRQPTA